MRGTEATVDGVKETSVFLSHFEDLPDYRQKGKVAYPLDEALLLMLAASLAGAETVADMARFEQTKLGVAEAIWDLRQWRAFAAFQRCFTTWTATRRNKIDIDGKTVRRSYQKKGAQEPIHVVSAFAAGQRMVLGQTKVDNKSNEIVAIPTPLGLLSAEGAVVTIVLRQAQDKGMGCQRAIAQKIIDKNADYILALKGNQGTLRDDVELYAREQKAVGFTDAHISRDETLDGDHGRIETRTVTVFHDVEWLQKEHQWPGLKSAVMVESKRESAGKTETETGFYITSLALLANALGR